MPRLSGPILLGVFLVAATAASAGPARIPDAALAARVSVSTASPPPGLIEALTKVVELDGAPGVTAIVLKGNQRLYRIDVGAIDPSAQMPIASASKWMTAVLTMTVVDEGRLNLDEPIGRRLPEFKGAAGEITLRQLLSFTAGQGSLTPMFDLKQNPRITLAQSASEIAALPLEDPPGAVFKYGAPSMQIVGALVEQATGQSWASLFEARIAKPLGLTQTYWSSPLRPLARPSAVHNPNLQAGVVTTAEDYAKFLSMLAAGGRYARGRIISPAAFEAMETAQTLKTPMAFRPPGMREGDQYAIGNWCEAYAATNSCASISSPGAFGTYPWIDRRTGLYGVFFLKHRLGPVADDLRAARQIIVMAGPPPIGRSQP